MLSPGAKNDNLPDELEAAALMLIAIGLSNEIEEMVIAGDESKDPNSINGMVKTLLGSSDAIQLAGTTLVKGNVLDAIEAVYNALPENVLQAEDAGTLYVLGSYNTRRLIRAALADKNNQVIAASWSVDDADKRNPKLFYLGVEFVPVKGIDNNTLIAYDSSNAYLLTDLLSDLDQIELGNFPKPNDDKVFIKGRLRLGFVVPFEDEIVIWSKEIATDSPGRPADGGLTVIPNSLVFKAAGETKTFIVLTDPAGDDPEFSANPNGFTVTPGTTVAGVTTVTVVASDNTGNRDDKVGEVDVMIEGKTTTVTLNHSNDTLDEIVP
jgi:hypothetical protein